MTMVTQNGQQVNGNGQRPTQRDLNELHRAYCRAMDVADNAAANDMPQKGELWQYAVEREELYMAAVFAAGQVTQ